MVVLGKHVDHLKFFDIMLGDEPALKPEQLTYQRMLAGDPIEVVEQAQSYLKEKPLHAYYEDVLIEALKLAQADSDRGHLDEERKQRIRDVVAELIRKPCRDIGWREHAESLLQPRRHLIDAMIEEESLIWLLPKQIARAGYAWSDAFPGQVGRREIKRIRYKKVDARSGGCARRHPEGYQGPGRARADPPVTYSFRKYDAPNAADDSLPQA